MLWRGNEIVAGFRGPGPNPPPLGPPADDKTSCRLPRNRDTAPPAAADPPSGRADTQGSPNRDNSSRPCRPVWRRWPWWALILAPCKSGFNGCAQALACAPEAESARRHQHDNGAPTCHMKLIPRLDVSLFAVQGFIKTQLFFLDRDLHAGELVDDPEHDVGEHERVHSRAHHGDTFLHEETAVAVEQAVGAGVVHRFVGEQPQTNHAEHSPHAVHAPDIEGV